MSSVLLLLTVRKQIHLKEKDNEVREELIKLRHLTNVSSSHIIALWYDPLWFTVVTLERVIYCVLYIHAIADNFCSSYY